MKHLLDEYGTLKSQKKYLKMIMANVINRFGDSIDAIAFTWLVYELTHSALWSTIVFGVNMLPTILIQPFVGALVERMRKRNIMVICDIARGFCVSIIAVFYLMGILTPWMLLTVTFMNSLLETLRIPAGIAIVPNLLDKEHYEKGIALNSSLSRVMELIGTGCAGFLIALLGVSFAIFIDAATFFISGAIIACIHCEEKVAKVKLSIQSYIITLKEGIHYVLNRKVLVTICVVGALINMLLSPINSLLPSYIDVVLQGGSEALSLLNIAITLGSILGSFFYPTMIKKLTKRNLLLISFFSCGLFFIGIILVPYILPCFIVSYGIIIVLFLILGFFSAATGTYVSVYMTANVEPSYMARVGAVFNAALCASIPLSSLLISLLLQVTSFINILLITGGFGLFVTIVLTRLKSLRKLDEKHAIIES